MTQGIENLLNLPHLEDLLNEQKLIEHADEAEPEIEIPDDVPPETVEAIKNAGRSIARHSEMEDGRDHADDMEKLHKEILRHSQDLMDLGFNVDVRSARGIFEVAATMYKSAIDAKNSKRDMQLKMMKMMLEKRKLDLQERQITGNDVGTVIKAEGVIIEDRNELIKMLRKAASEKQENNK